MLPVGCAAYHALLAATYLPYIACGESYLGGECRRGSRKWQGCCITDSPPTELGTVPARPSETIGEWGLIGESCIVGKGGTNGVGTAAGERERRTASAGRSSVAPANNGSWIAETLSAGSVRAGMATGVASGCGTDFEAGAVGVSNSWSLRGHALEDFM
jgi:hypothetical protein